MTEPDPTPDQVDRTGESDTSTRQAKSKNSTDDSGSLFTRREIIGSLAAAGVIGATASASTDGDAAASIGGGPMADPLSEFTAKPYTMTWSEYQTDVSAGVEGRVIIIDDDTEPDHHGKVLYDDGASIDLVDRKYKSVTADEINSTEYLDQYVSGGAGTDTDPYDLGSITLDQLTKYVLPSGEFETAGIDTDPSLDYQEGAIYLHGAGVRATELNNDGTDESVVKFLGGAGGGNFGGVSHMTIHGQGQGTGPQTPLIYGDGTIYDQIYENLILRYTDASPFVLESGSSSGVRFAKSWVEASHNWGVEIRGGSRAKLSDLHVTGHHEGGLKLSFSKSQVTGLSSWNVGTNPSAGNAPGTGVYIDEDFNGFTNLYIGDGADQRIRDAGRYNQWTNLFLENSSNDEAGLYLEGARTQVTNVIGNNVDPIIEVRADESVISNVYNFDNPTTMQIIADNVQVSNVNGYSSAATARAFRVDGSQIQISNANFYGTATWDISFGSRATECVLSNIQGVPYSEITWGGTRNVVNGYSVNSGDPNSTGQWNGEVSKAGELGVTVWDTSTSPWTPYKAQPDGGNWVAI